MHVSQLFFVRRDGFGDVCHAALQTHVALVGLGDMFPTIRRTAKAFVDAFLVRATSRDSERLDRRVVGIDAFAYALELGAQAGQYGIEVVDGLSDVRQVGGANFFMLRAKERVGQARIDAFFVTAALSERI